MNRPHRRELLCCTKCGNPTTVPDLTPELIETPDGYVMGHRCYSACCQGDVEFKFACTECEKVPAVTHDDACIPCAVYFYVRYDDEYREALDYGLRDYEVGRQVAKLVECRRASDALQFIGRSDLGAQHGRLVRDGDDDGGHRMKALALALFGPPTFFADIGADGIMRLYRVQGGHFEPVGDKS
jgi:hypothetical protein